MMIQDSISRAGLRLPLSRRVWLLLGLGLAGLMFLSTLQTTISGSVWGYTIDTGEIQNALPRWGTLHWPGYPQYSFTGSLLVNGFRLGGVPPAAGASLVSALWGVVAVGLLVLLAYELDVPGPAALVGALIFASSTSVWIDASLAEVHTLTMTFTLAAIYFALRFGQTGRRRDLLWLAVVFSQGAVHQRSLLFAGPGLAVLIAPRWRTTVRHLPGLVPLAGLAPLTYLYIQLRTWMGDDWIFGELVDERRNFWEMLVDNQADRLIELPASLSGWQTRWGRLATVLDKDLPLPLVAVGLVAVACLLWPRSRRWALGLSLIWLPYGLVGLLMWKPYVGDALLAVKLPLLMGTGLGWALLSARVSNWLRGRRWEGGLRVAGVIVLLVGLAWLWVSHYPQVTSVTHDTEAGSIVAAAERIEPLIEPDSPPFLALWGNQYWVLSYVQAYEGRLSGLELVNHVADWETRLNRHGELWALTSLFQDWPVWYLEQRVGQRLYLSSLAPGVVRLAIRPRIDLKASSSEPLLDLENGIEIVSADLVRRSDRRWWLQLAWRAEEAPLEAYEVVVQVLTHDPPRRPDDFMKLIYVSGPVGGWYPTDRWVAGEVVSDHYLIRLPPEAEPVAVRVALRRPHPHLETTPWLSLPFPASGGERGNSEAPKPGPSRAWGPGSGVSPGSAGPRR